MPTMTDVEHAHAPHAPHGPVRLADILAQVRRRTPPFLDFVEPSASARPGDVALGHTLSPELAGTVVALAREQGLAREQVLSVVELYDPTAPGLMLAVVTVDAVARWYVDGTDVRELRVPARDVGFTDLSTDRTAGTYLTISVVGTDTRPVPVRLGTLLDRRDATILEQALVRALSGSGSSVRAAP